MANLMGHHVGLGDVTAPGVEPGCQLVVEGLVDVDRLVRRAVMGPDGGCGAAASRLGDVPEQHQGRLDVGQTGIGEYGSPRVVRRAEDDAGELLVLVDTLELGGLLARIRRLGTRQLIHHLVETGSPTTQQCDQQEDDGTDAAQAADRHAWPAHPAPVHDVSATLDPLPTRHMNSF